MPDEFFAGHGGRKKGTFYLLVGFALSGGGLVAGPEAVVRGHQRAAALVIYLLAVDAMAGSGARATQCLAA